MLTFAYTYVTKLMLRCGCGVGHVNVRLRPEVDATFWMGWGGVGHVNVRLHLRDEGYLGFGGGTLFLKASCAE